MLKTYKEDCPVEVTLSVVEFFIEIQGLTKCNNVIITDFYSSLQVPLRNALKLFAIRPRNTEQFISQFFSNRPLFGVMVDSGDMNR